MPSVKLYCLPYSGASAALYYRWQRQLPAWLRVVPVELPGRGLRIAEPLHTDVRTLVAHLAADLRSQLDDGPYAVFGHSLGAILAFELVHELIRRRAPAPLSLFVAGTSAPTRRQRSLEELSSLKTDEAVVAYLRKLGGTPDEVLANEELMGMTLPIVKADFKLCESYTYAAQSRIPCHLAVLSGRGDDIPGDDLLAWQAEAGDAFSLTMFDGGHFFIHENQVEVLHFIGKHFNRSLPHGPGRGIAVVNSLPGSLGQGGASC